MRSRVKFSRRVRIIFLIVVFSMVSYFYGFKNGEQSVYKKSINDAELLKLYGKQNK